VNRAFRPSNAPGRRIAWITRITNMTTSRGMATMLDFAMPFCTPRTMMMIRATHTSRKVTRIGTTQSMLRWTSAPVRDCVYSPKKYASGSSPQRLSTENTM
jgi:hypothetical protein